MGRREMKEYGSAQLGSFKSPCLQRSRRRRTPHRLFDAPLLRVSPSEPLRKGRPAPPRSFVPGGP
eukprot:7372372-Pyramimonas_sp.AAC.1